MKKLLFLPLLFISVTIVSQVDFGQLGADIDGEAANDLSGSSVTMNANGDRVAIGADGNDGTGTYAGHVRIYDWNGTSWIQLGADIDGEAANDYSGSSVTMNANGDRVAIGAYGNDGNGPSAGHVRIYDWNGTAWIQLGADIDGEAANDLSGKSVSMNAAGDRVAIGAYGNDGTNGNINDNRGHVRIYDWNGTAWIKLGTNIDGEAAGDYSGYSVSMNAAGDRLAIGAYFNDGNGADAGHVRIYDWNGTAWTQLGADIDGEVAGDWSGSSVSMNAAGDRLAIGADLNDGNGSNAGHVRIYDWNGTAWIKLGTDIDGEAAGDYSGYSVSMNAAGDRLAIGAFNNDGNGSNAGHVRIYDWNGTAWSQLGLDIDGESAGDKSGYSVSMNAAGDIVAIGAPNNDGTGPNAGHVRIYEECTSSYGADSITAGGCYTWIDGITYTSSVNTPTFSLTNSAGCDSIVTLNLTITPLLVGTDSITACDSYTWINGNTYTSSVNTPTFTLTNAAGCDSIVTLNLTITPLLVGTDSITACDSYTWIDGNTYTSSVNTPTFTLTNAAGCDSLVTLNLTVNNKSYRNDSVTACGSYTWINGNTYTLSNDTAAQYTSPVVNSVGCDSIIILDLTINNIPSPDFTSNVSSFTSAPFLVEFSNITPNLSDCNFMWNFGDNSTLQSNNPLVFHEYQYNGLYDVSLIAENIVSGCTDTMIKTDNIYCTGGPSVSITEVSNQINIFPNPTNENITISVENFNGNIQTEVYDLIGNMLQVSNETTISLQDYARGIYLLKVAYGDRVEEIKVIKD